MKTDLTTSQKFWIAMLVVGGYMLFGALATFLPKPEGTVIIVNTVLATMGPLVGMVVKGLFDTSHPTGEKNDPVNTKEVSDVGMDRS